MVQKMNTTTVSETDKKAVNELQGTALLNTAICQFLMKDYQRSVNNAQESLKFSRTVKGYYRLGQAYKAMHNYDDAIKAYTEGRDMDPSDPNGIQKEIEKCHQLENAKE